MNIALFAEMFVKNHSSFQTGQSEDPCCIPQKDLTIYCLK